jgi:hypothetical protein
MKRVVAIAVMALGLTAGGAQAALVKSADGNLVNDQMAHLTWTADMNLMSTQAANYSGGYSAYINQVIAEWGPNTTFGTRTHQLGASDFNPDGRMNWFGAIAWANHLNATMYGGYTGWRLPTIIDDYSSVGFPDGAPGHPAQSSSELATLFFGNLGQQQYQSIVTTNNGSAGYNLFTNVQGEVYWFGTEVLFDERPSPAPVDSWGYAASGGYQVYVYDIRSPRFAIAVRDGDLTASVPEPGTVVLLSLSLGAMAWVARRKQA